MEDGVGKVNAGSQKLLQLTVCRSDRLKTVKAEVYRSVRSHYKAGRPDPGVSKVRQFASELINFARPLGAKGKAFAYSKSPGTSHVVWKLNLTVLLNGGHAVGSHISLL